MVSGSALVGITGKDHIKHFSLFGGLFNELIQYSKLNKLYNTRILINEQCYRKVHHSFLVRLVDVITICKETKQWDRGIFEVHSEKVHSKSEEWYYTYSKSMDMDQRMLEYNKAWIHFTNKEFQEALECLEKYEAKHPHDAHAARLRKRIEYRIESNPLLDLTIRLHDSAALQRTSSSTYLLYNSSKIPEKHEKIDLKKIKIQSENYALSAIDSSIGIPKASS